MLINYDLYNNTYNVYDMNYLNQPTDEIYFIFFLPDLNTNYTIIFILKVIKNIN